MKKTYLLLLFVIIIAAGFRLVSLQAAPPGLYPDEAMNGNNALEALETHDFKVFYPENNGREGLFINIQAVFVKFLGNEAWVLRLPSALFGIFTVLGIYFLTRELFKKDNIALLAAFLLATSFWYINFSRIGFRAIMAPFFLTWAIYFLLKSMGRAGGRKMFLYSALGGIFYGLGFYSYIAYRATPILILLVVFLFWFKEKDPLFRRRILLATIYFLLATFIIALPLGLYFLENPADFFGRTTQISVFNSQSPIKDLTINSLKTAGMFNIIGDYNWRHNISGRPELFWPIGLMFLVGTIIALRYLIRNVKYKILIAWLIVAALPVVISNEGMPHALRAIIMIPPVMILAAIGGIKVYEWLKRKVKSEKILKLASAVFLALLVFETYQSYFITWARNSNTADAFAANYVKIAEELNKVPFERPKFIIVKAGGIDVRGLPMPAQTVMFLTDTFGETEREKKNFFYLTAAEAEKITIPPQAFVVTLE